MRNPHANAVGVPNNSDSHSAHSDLQYGCKEVDMVAAVCGPCEYGVMV